MTRLPAPIGLLLAAALLPSCRALPLAEVEGEHARSVVEVRPLTTRPTVDAFRPDPDLLFGDDLAVLVIRKTEMRSYPWPDPVPPEERRRIEEAIHAALEIGGRDGDDGEAYLVALDRGAPASALKASGRLVSEFKRILENEDLAEPMTRAKLMVLDNVLRKIDGVQERRIGDHEGIRVQTPEDRIREVALIWNWWYLHERFHRRYPPWDPRIDGVER